jgi:hypothetical protein
MAGDHGAGREVSERAQHERTLVHARVRQHKRGDAHATAAE